MPPLLWPMRRASSLGLAIVLLLPACSEEDPAIVRGDRLWADSSYTTSLAEYRLAVRQDGDDEDALVRLAHAYVQTRQPERAREVYDRLIALAPEFRDQAVFDFLLLGDRALERGDRQGMAAAVGHVLELRPDLPLPAFQLPLARYHAEIGEREQAIRYYERALALSPADSAARLFFEVGRLQEELGRCRQAIGYFEAYGQQAPRGELADEARWRAGNCAFALAREAHEQGQYSEALQQLETTIGLGVPKNLQDQAWFQRGEALMALGDQESAVQAFERVLELTPTQAGQLYDRARRRIEQIQFGIGAVGPFETQGGESGSRW